MYYYVMKRDEIKKILSKHYASATCDAILRGDRKPKYEVMIKLAQDSNIPFDAWLNIQSFIANHTPKETLSTTTNQKNFIGVKNV